MIAVEFYGIQIVTESLEDTDKGIVGLIGLLGTEMRA
jgi:hypothetical protein